MPEDRSTPEGDNLFRVESGKFLYIFIGNGGLPVSRMTGHDYALLNACFVHFLEEKGHGFFVG